VLNLKIGELGKVMNVRERKTGKNKCVAVSEGLAKRLDVLKHGYLASPSEYAFLSTRKPHAHINRSTYHRHLKNAARGTQIECSAHSTRKLYAHNIYDEHKNIYEVQKALNHKYITTTAVYMGLDIMQLIRDAMQHSNIITEKN